MDRHCLCGRLLDHRRTRWLLPMRQKRGSYLSTRHRHEYRERRSSYIQGTARYSSAISCGTKYCTGVSSIRDWLRIVAHASVLPTSGPRDRMMCFFLFEGLSRPLSFAFRMSRRTATLPRRFCCFRPVAKQPIRRTPGRIYRSIYCFSYLPL